MTFVQEQTKLQQMTWSPVSERLQGAPPLLDLFVWCKNKLGFTIAIVSIIEGQYELAIEFLNTLIEHGRIDSGYSEILSFPNFDNSIITTTRIWMN